MSAELNIDKGEFIRSVSDFRNWVTRDGSAGASGEGGFMAESGRYHLYVSYACPWAHRTLIFRMLKGLEDVISVSVVHPLMPAESWVFDEYPGATEDHVNQAHYLYENYLKADPDFDGLVTVPVLWDKKRLIEYPNLWIYTRELYQVPGVAQTVNLDHIKNHYFGSHRSINPTGIVPKGPEIDFMRPHGRNES